MDLDLIFWFYLKKRKKITTFIAESTFLYMKVIVILNRSHSLDTSSSYWDIAIDVKAIFLCIIILHYVKIGLLFFVSLLNFLNLFCQFSGYIFGESDWKVPELIIITLPLQLQVTKNFPDFSCSSKKIFSRLSVFWTPKKLMQKSEYIINS